MFLISFNFKINCIYYGSYSYQVFHMKIDINVCIQGTIYKQKKNYFFDRSETTTLRNINTILDPVLCGFYSTTL